MALCVLLISLVSRPGIITLGQNDRQSWFTRAGNTILSHRTSCVILTVLTLASVSTSLVQVYQSDPIFYSFPPTPRQALPVLSICFNFVSFLGSGSMRRGPKKYYQVPPMQLGSGLQATAAEDDEGLRRWLAGEEGGVEPEANVLDYDGCGILSLMIGSYVSPLDM